MEQFRIILIIFALLAWSRTFLFVISAAAARGNYRDQSVADLEYELKQIRQRRMEREKKRSKK